MLGTLLTGTCRRCLSTAATAGSHGLFRFRTVDAQRRIYANSLSPPVLEALRAGRAVVALESTVITHGLPHPTNIQTARRLEQLVRENGAEPATVLLFGGKIHVGLTDAAWRTLEEGHGEGKKSDRKKVSRRDIALTTNLVGGTTVAATMWAAHQVGIRVFATGGIGGVHVGASESFDVSADLVELARTPVAVVCAGPKGLLDLGKTVEFLETHGVNVLSYSNDRRMAGFMQRYAPFETQHACAEDIDLIARVIQRSADLGLSAGTLVSVPHRESGEDDAIQAATDQAVRLAREQGLSGQAVTPYVLAKVRELTGDKAMHLNVKILENNAVVAARLATRLAAHDGTKGDRGAVIKARNRSVEPRESGKHVLVVGGSAVDYEAIASEPLKLDGGFYRGRVVSRAGGVARNHADALGRLGCDVHFLTVLPEDAGESQLVRRSLPDNVDLGPAKLVPNATVPSSVSIFSKPEGRVLYGVGLEDSCTLLLTQNDVTRQERLFEQVDQVVLDVNVPDSAFNAVISLSHKHGKPLWIDPTDVCLVPRVFSSLLQHRSRLPTLTISPNLAEFLALADLLFEHADERRLRKHVQAAIQSQDKDEDFLAAHMAPLARDVVRLLGSSLSLHRHFLKIGVDKRGTLLIDGQDGEPIIIPPPSLTPAGSLVSVTGAGDCWNAGYIAATLEGLDKRGAVERAQRCAAAALKSEQAVPVDLANRVL